MRSSFDGEGRAGDAFESVSTSLQRAGECGAEEVIVEEEGGLVSTSKEINQLNWEEDVIDGYVWS